MVGLRQPLSEKGRHRFSLKAEEFSASIPITLHVWNFALPERNHLETAFGLDVGAIFRYQNLKIEADKRRGRSSSDSIGEEVPELRLLPGRSAPAGLPFRLPPAAFHEFLRRHGVRPRARNGVVLGVVGGHHENFSGGWKFADQPFDDRVGREVARRKEHFQAPRRQRGIAARLAAVEDDRGLPRHAERGGLGQAHQPVASRLDVRTQHSRQLRRLVQQVVSVDNEPVVVHSCLCPAPRS